MRRLPAMLGQMRRRLTLEAPVDVPDGAGGVIRSHAPVATLWAQLSFDGGTERSRAGRPEQAASYRVTMRWRSGIDAGMRLADGDRRLEILTAGDPDGRRQRLVCRCQEISA